MVAYWLFIIAIILVLGVAFIVGAINGVTRRIKEIEMTDKAAIERAIEGISTYCHERSLSPEDSVYVDGLLKTIRQVLTTALTRGYHMFGSNERYERAKRILKDVVGLSWDNETKSIHMTPDSFVRCIDKAALTPRPAEVESDYNEALHKVVMQWCHDVLSMEDCRNMEIEIIRLYASQTQDSGNEGWQDISTAPKDGSHFTVLIGDQEFDCFWYVHPAVSGWCSDDLDCNDFEFNPTLWKPTTQPEGE